MEPLPLPLIFQNPDDVIEFEIHADPSPDLRRSKTPNGSIIWRPEGSAPVEIPVFARFRGGNRRTACQVVPLEIDIKKHRKAEGTPFKKLNGFDVVTHCQGRSDDPAFSFNQLVIKEFLAYRLQNLFAKVSLAVKLAYIRYVNPTTNKVSFGYAFLREGKKAMARRFGYEHVHISKVPAVVDHWQLVEAKLVNELVCNTDTVFQPNASANRNYFGIRISKDQVACVPYDYNFSGWVSQDYRTKCIWDYNCTYFSQRFGLEFLQEAVKNGEEAARHLMQERKEHLDSAEIQFQYVLSHSLVDPDEQMVLRNHTRTFLAGILKDMPLSALQAVQMIKKKNTDVSIIINAMNRALPFIKTKQEYFLLVEPGIGNPTPEYLTELNRFYFANIQSLVQYPDTQWGDLKQIEVYCKTIASAISVLTTAVKLAKTPEEFSKTFLTRIPSPSEDYLNELDEAAFGNIDLFWKLKPTPPEVLRFYKTLLFKNKGRFLEMILKKSRSPLPFLEFAESMSKLLEPTERTTLDRAIANQVDFLIILNPDEMEYARVIFAIQDTQIRLQVTESILKEFPNRRNLLALLGVPKILLEQSPEFQTGFERLVTKYQEAKKLPLEKSF